MAKFVAYTGREELAKLTFQWNISEFKKQIKTAKVGESVSLEDVNVGETNWLFELYPHGKTAIPTGNDAVGVYAFSLNEAPVTAKVSVSVMKHTENSTSVDTKSIFTHTYSASNTSTNDGFGSYRLLTHKKIKDDASLLSNGTLHLVIKLTVFGEVKTTRKLINNADEIGSIENQERLKVTEHLKDKWATDNYSDVHIMCSGQIFYCHRMILARSQYFSSMLESGMKESEIKVINLEYTDVDILKGILKFIYGGEIDNLERNAVDLLKAAGMFIMEDLKDVCEKYLVANYLKLDNVIDMVVMAETHNADHLKKAALDMIAANNDEIVKQVGWKEKLDNSSKKLLLEIIEAMAGIKPPASAQ